MALAPCPDCGNQCSLTATFCPKCGRSFKPGELLHTLSKSLESVEPNTVYPTSAIQSSKKRIPIPIAILIVLACVLVTVAVLSALHWTGNLDGWLHRDTTSNNATQGTSNADQSISPKARADSLSPQAVTATREALTALRKIDAATQVGVSYMQYGPLVIDAKAKVNEALSPLPDGDLKRELGLAMDTYADASQAWSGINGTGLAALESQNEAFAKLRDKYHAPSNIQGAMLYKEPAPVLTFFWQKARTHLDRASSLLNQ